MNLSLEVQLTIFSLLVSVSFLFRIEFLHDIAAHGHFSSESGCNRWVPDEKHENDRQAALESLQRFKCAFFSLFHFPFVVYFPPEWRNLVLGTSVC